MSDGVQAVAAVEDAEAVSIDNEPEVFVSLESEPEIFVDCVLEGDNQVEAIIAEPAPASIVIQEQLQINRIVYAAIIGDMYMSIAAVALSGHRVVGVNENDMAEYVSCDVLEDAFKAYGISTHAAEQGAEIEILMSGEIEEPSWNWEPHQPIFLGLSGMLTQNAPETIEITKFHLNLGWAVTPTKMKIRIEEPIIRG